MNRTIASIAFQKEHFGTSLCSPSMQSNPALRLNLQEGQICRQSGLQVARQSVTRMGMIDFPSSTSATLTIVFEDKLSVAKMAFAARASIDHLAPGIPPFHIYPLISLGSCP